MKKIIIPTDEHAKQAFETAFPGFEVSNIEQAMPGVVWTATVKGKFEPEQAFAKFSQRSGWFVDTRR